MSTEQPQAKKARVEDGLSEGDETKEFDTETQKALEEVDSCQNELDALNEKASEEILQVEQKYNKLRKPHYEKRNQAIQQIDHFWMTAFINHPQISAILEEDEEDCLQYMDKVEVEEFEDIKSGYRIKLHFKTNPYFENEELVKEFHLATSGDPASQSQAIKWKDGKNLVQKAEQDQAAIGKKRKMMGGPRTFFQWYMDNTEPAADDIAEVIKDDMWPNPLQYFLASDADGEENGLDSDEGEEGEESVVVMDEEEDEEDEEGLEEEEEEEGEDELDEEGEEEAGGD